MLNIIIGALFDESISTPGIAIERQTVHFRRTYFQLGNLHSSCIFATWMTGFIVCENEADYVLCTPTNYECKLTNWKCVLRKCTVCSSIALLGVEMDSSKRAPMIMFNMYMTQFTCSHHGILIREKSPLIWMLKENLKGIVSYVKN